MNDDKTLKLIEEVKRRKKEIQDISRARWKTTCSFPIFGTTNTINIRAIMSVSEILSYAASLLTFSEGCAKAAKELGLEKPPICIHGGFEIEEWMQDFKSRIAQLSLQEKKNKLAQYEERLNRVISPELKARLELEEIEKELNEDS